MRLKPGIPLLLALAVSIFAEEPKLKQRPPLPETNDGCYRVAQGQRIPVRFLNTVSTRTAAEGDRVYLQTVFPVSVSDRIVIPAGSYIDAQVTEVKRAGRLKGRAELYVRLGQLTLPNGIQRALRADFEKARDGALEGSPKEHPLLCPAGMISSAFIMKGPDVTMVPGTTADIVLTDAIVFSREDLNR